MRFKIDWASLIVGSKFTVFALFHFVFSGGFFALRVWGAYIWRGLYMEGLIFGILRYPHKAIRHNPDPVVLAAQVRCIEVLPKSSLKIL